MIRIYKIEYTSTAPRLEPLELDENSLPSFDGSKIGARWPATGLPVREVGSAESKFSFYWIAPGALAYPEKVIAECDDFYWTVTQNIEPLHAMAEATVFNVVNVTAWLEKPRRGEYGYREGAPCTVVDFYAPLFRIRGERATELFCASGFTNPLNEFKGVYDQFGFSVLEFLEVWHGKA